MGNKEETEQFNHEIPDEHKTKIYSYPIDHSQEPIHFIPSRSSDSKYLKAPVAILMPSSMMSQHIES
jgi:hypothetical protein